MLQRPKRARICSLRHQRIETILVLIATFTIRRTVASAFIPFTSTSTPITTDVLSHTTAVPTVPKPLLLPHPNGVATLPLINTVPPTKELSKDSTAADVLQVLATTNNFAPYAGPNGVAVVTGGSSGIGAPTVEALASTGMKIVLCARNPYRARKVVESMPYSNIRVQPLDLADLNSVQNAVEEICATEGNVDLILNNAGLNSVPTRQVTAQGLEMQFGVNHVGHFYLTRLLLPHVKSGGRVVTVSSNAHSSIRKMHQDDLNMEKTRYSPWFSYSQSKLANILFSKGLQDKLRRERSTICSLSLHPGIVMTNLWRHNDHALVDAVSDYMVTKSTEQGAATNVFCCLADACHFNGGDYVVDCQITEPNSNGRDTNLRDLLWDETERMIENAGFRLPNKIV